jgi:hypothetical protein
MTTSMHKYEGCINYGCDWTVCSESNYGEAGNDVQWCRENGGIFVVKSRKEKEE